MSVGAFLGERGEGDWEAACLACFFWGGGGGGGGGRGLSNIQKIGQFALLL